MNQKERKKYYRKAEMLLKDMEVFHSSRFLRFLQRIGKEITDKHNAQIRLYSATNDGRAGYFEGTYIYLNLINAITQSFPTLDLRIKSLIGIAGHECGHQNYSNIYLRSKYVDGIANGILYPKFPIPETEKERESLKKLTKLFQEKDRETIEIYLTVAARLHGYLEDVFVEEKMCRRYPGSIRQGILQNRKRNMEKIESLKSHVFKGKSRLKIMLLVLFQYMFTHKVNTWDGEVDEYMELLKECIPILTWAAYDIRDSSRYIATNQILLKIWPFLEEEIDILKDKKKQNEMVRSQNEHTTPDLSGLLEELPQYSEEPTCRKIRMKKKEATDINWSAPNNNLKAEDIDLKDVEQSQKYRFKGLTKGNVNPSNINESDEEISDMILSLEDDYVKIIDIDKEILSIRREIIKENAQKLFNETMRERLKQLLEETEFTSVNRQIPKVILRKEDISVQAYQNYEKIKPEIKHVVGKMKSSLLPILKKKRNQVLKRLYVGKKLDTSNLWDPQKRVFQSKVTANNLDVVIGFLMDQSGSIDQTRWKISVLTALSLVEFAQILRIPIFVNGHCTGRRIMNGVIEEIMCIHSYLEFEDRESDRARILDMKTEGANRDGAALQYMAEKLKKRKEKMKLLIFFCDGLPNADNYGGQVARDDLKEVQRKLKREGITLLVAAIGRDQEEIRGIYGNSCINVDDLEELPTQILKRLIEGIA